ncbi:MAG: xylulokinase [Proteobacteria bacterium]|nr:xylulokinase [Pseudomonadota bacterium]
MTDAFLGVDLGTSAVKVLALSGKGQVLAKAKHGYPTHTPQTNWAEQSPRHWWAAVCAALKEVLRQLGGVTIAGVGFSGQMNGFVLVDDRDRVLHDAIIWLDLRAGAQATALQHSHGDVITATTGNQISPIAVLPKLAWMAQHRPDLMRRTKRLFLAKDYLLWRLTGAHVTDPSDAAATALMDVHAGRWSPILCKAAGIDRKILPEIRPSCAVVGHVSAQAGAECDLLRGTPVVPGAADVAALSVGCGVLGDGVLGVTLGTAGHVVLSAAGPPAWVSGEFWRVAHADPDRSIWLGLVMSGGLSLSWLHGILTALGTPPDSFEDMVALSESAPPGARGVVFLPFLQGAATPYNQPSARATFHGLTSSHGAAELVQAVMEGVAYNIRECVELFERLGGRMEELRLAEGGSRVPRWCQIVADVLNRPALLVEEDDASALGAAIMACASVHRRPLGEVIDECVAIKQNFTPILAHRSAYEEAYQRYQGLARAEARDLTHGSPG